MSSQEPYMSVHSSIIRHDCKAEKPKCASAGERMSRARRVRANERCPAVGEGPTKTCSAMDEAQKH